MKKAIVIGSGFGGLASSLRLKAKGYDVLVLESLSEAGGRARSFKIEDFIFDAGPTVITAPYLIEELFSLFNKKSQDYFELLPVDPFYRIMYWDGSVFDYVGNQERLLEQIRSFNPEDVDGYLKLAAHAERIFDIGYMKLADAPFENVSEMLRVLPDMVKLQNYYTVYGLVSKYIKDERLRQAFSFQPLLVGGNPFQTTSIYLLIHWLERKWGVHFARGGTTAIVNALLRLMQEEGITIQYNSPVETIRVENGKTTGVALKDGQFLPCDLVVSNADPMMVYSKMIDKSHRKRHADWRLKLRRPSMGLFVGYFGTNKIYSDLAHHTILLGPRYKGLLDDIFNNYKLANDFSLYLHAPARTDTAMAPTGKDAFYVLSPVPNQKSKIDWSKEGPRYFERILKSLDQRAMPGLMNSLTAQHFITPDYFERDLKSFQGAGFGLEPIFRQSAYFRFHNRSEDVRGLYFVGASTHPGAGVPGVLCSAKVLDKLLPSANEV